MILCINDCEIDQTLDQSRDVMYSTKQVVLDFSTETLDTPGDKDLPAYWYVFVLSFVYLFLECD